MGKNCLGFVSDLVQARIGQFSLQRRGVKQRGLADIGNHVDQRVPGVATRVTDQGSILTTGHFSSHRDRTDQAVVADAVQLHVLGVVVVQEASRIEDHVGHAVIELAVIETDVATQSVGLDLRVDTEAALVVRGLVTTAVHIPNVGHPQILPA
ncbi:hypothetical protein D3C85_1223000 [compost metagenome]